MIYTEINSGNIYLITHASFSSRRRLQMLMAVCLTSEPSVR